MSNPGGVSASRRHPWMDSTIGNAVVRFSHQARYGKDEVFAPVTTLIAPRRRSTSPQHSPSPGTDRHGGSSPAASSGSISPASAMLRMEILRAVACPLETADVGPFLRCNQDCWRIDRCTCGASNCTPRAVDVCNESSALAPSTARMGTGVLPAHPQEIP